MLSAPSPSSVPWLTANATAIQALASVATLFVTVVLAWFTRKYVLLTRDLAAAATNQAKLAERQAKSAEDQARLAATQYREQMDAAVGDRKATAAAFKAKAESLLRLLAGVAFSSEPDTPNDRSIRNAGIWTETDLTELRTLGRSVPEIDQKWVHTATEELGALLDQIVNVRNVSPAHGFEYTDTFRKGWQTRVQLARSALTVLVQQAETATN